MDSIRLSINIFAIFLLLGSITAFRIPGPMLPNPENDTSGELEASENKSSNDSIQTRALLLANPDDKFVKHAAKLWPGGAIIYGFDRGFSSAQRGAIEAAMRAFANATCLRFKQVEKVKRNRTNLKLGAVRINSGSPPNGGLPCSSDIGFLNAPRGQNLYLNPTHCYGSNLPKYTGVAAHELMHTFGFLHEFQRRDRLNYLAKATYETLIGDTKGLPFNYDSISQYEPHNKFFEKRGDDYDKTAPKPFGKYDNMGHFCLISIGDRMLIDRTYADECGKPENREVVYTKAVKIEGTDCKDTLDPMDDEKMN